MDMGLWTTDDGWWGMGLSQLLESAIADLANEYLFSEQEIEELVEHALRPAGQRELQGCGVHRRGLPVARRPAVIAVAFELDEVDGCQLWCS